MVKRLMLLVGKVWPCEDLAGLVGRMKGLAGQGAGYGKQRARLALLLTLGAEKREMIKAWKR